MDTLDRSDLAFLRSLVLKDVERRDAEAVAVNADEMAAKLGTDKVSFLHYVSVTMLPEPVRMEDGVWLYDVQRTLRTWKILKRERLLDFDDLD